MSDSQKASSSFNVITIQTIGSSWVLVLEKPQINTAQLFIYSDLYRKVLNIQLVHIQFQAPARRHRVPCGGIQFSLLTCRVKHAGVVENSVNQEVVGGDTELSTAVLVTAVSCDDGEQLHLKADAQLLRCSEETEEKANIWGFSEPFWLMLERGI